MKKKFLIIFNLYILFFFVPLVFADTIENSFQEHLNTNCKEAKETDSLYAMTYDEKMKIASKKFNSAVNKEEIACNPEITKSKSGASGGASIAGNISGTQTSASSKQKESASKGVGSNSIIENKSQSDSLKNNKMLSNGKIPECISGYKDDDELAAAMKQAIVLETDDSRKKELIKNYANYKGINIKEDQC
jgi:hypothetical protein